MDFLYSLSSISTKSFCFHPDFLGFTLVFRQSVIHQIGIMWLHLVISGLIITTSDTSEMKD